MRTKSYSLCSAGLLHLSFGFFIAILLFGVSGVAYAIQSRIESSKNIGAPSQKIQPINLVINAALKRNPEILKTHSLSNAAQAATREARSGFLPQVNASYSAGKENYLLGDDRTNLNFTSGAVVVTQPIFSGMGTYNLWKQRQEENKAATFDENLAKENLALNITNVYLDILRLQELHKLTLDNIKVQRQILSKIRKKVNAGAGHQADLNLAIARVSQRETTLRTIENSQESAKEYFIRLTGFVPQKFLVPTIPALPATRKEAQDLGLVSSHRLSLAQASFKAAKRSVSVAKSNFSPQVKLEMSAAGNHNVSGYAGRTRDIKGMVVVSYNLLAGGSNIATLEKSTQKRQAALYNYNDLRNRTIEDINRAWDKFETDKLRLQSLKRYAKSSASVLRDYKLQFDLGRNSLLNVLDMENEVFTADSNVIAVKYAVIGDSYYLLAVMGKLIASLYAN